MSGEPTKGEPRKECLIATQWSPRRHRRTRPRSRAGGRGVLKRRCRGLQVQVTGTS